MDAFLQGVRCFGHEITELEFLSWLRMHGFLSESDEAGYNRPSAYCLRKGWMEDHRTTVQKPGGKLLIEQYPLLTMRGCQAFLPPLLEYLSGRDEGKDVFQRS